MEQPTKYLGRYLPVLTVVVLQVALIAIAGEPTGSDRVLGADRGNGAGASAGGAGALDNGSGTPVSGEGSAAASGSGVGATAGSSGGSTAAGATGSATGSSGRAGAGASKPAAAADRTAAAATAAAPAGGAGGQRVDSVGRPLDGDRSKSAPNGQLQEAVSLSSPPCIPRFTGNNGGSTSTGVTADTVKIVVWQPDRGAISPALAAAGLSMTPQQADDVNAILGEFINRHYELYGRKVELINYNAPETDPVAIRADAKRLVALHHPFAVVHRVQLMPKPVSEQLAQLGTIVVGASGFADPWYVRHDPFVWSQYPQGYRMADMTGDYYCKRMAGKNATQAGDPALRLKRRKVAVVTSQDPDELAVGIRFKEDVTGRMCGSSGDGTVLYTYATDQATAQNDIRTLVTRMKNDGITTVFGVSSAYRGLAYQEQDRQQFLPENLTSDLSDNDLVGRFFVATTSATQMQNTFGLGFQSAAQPNRDKEYATVMRSINPTFEPPVVAEGVWYGLSLVARGLQYAGPRLTPQTFKVGMRDVPQIGGWENADPWPGWKCCNRFLPMYFPGVAQDSYTARADARQIHWDNGATSPADGAPGAWVGVDGSRRYAIGKWTQGEPKQP